MPTSSRWSAWSALLLLGSGLLDITPSLRGIGATVVSVLLIGGLVLGERQPLSRLLGLPVPVFLGRISYGTYLWHWPVIVALTTLFDTSPAIIAILALALGTGLAALSYEILEMPIRKSKVLNRFTWPVAARPASASAPWSRSRSCRACSSRTASPPSPAASPGPSTAGVPGADEPIPQDIDWEQVGGSTGGQHWCPADDGAACTVRKGDGPHVLFIGDSQASTLVPMFEKLAEEHDLTLSLDVLAGCPWQEGLLNAKQADVERRGVHLRPASAGTTRRWPSSTRTSSCSSIARGTTRTSGATLVSRRDGRDQPLTRRCPRPPARRWTRSAPSPAGRSSSSAW